MLLSQHRVSSSKTVRPRVPCGAQCMRHTITTWPAVCSAAPHSQFGKGARPHLCIDEWNLEKVLLDVDTDKNFATSQNIRRCLSELNNYDEALDYFQGVIKKKKKSHWILMLMNVLLQHCTTLVVVYWT